MSDLSEFRKEQLQDPEFREYYLNMKVSSDIAKAIVAGRLCRNLTQKELSLVTGITQSDISRAERCEGNLTLRTLQRIAKGLDMVIDIKLVPIENFAGGEE